MDIQQRIIIFIDLFYQLLYLVYFDAIKESDKESIIYD